LILSMPRSKHNARQKRPSQPPEITKESIPVLKSSLLLAQDPTNLPR